MGKLQSVKIIIKILLALSATYSFGTPSKSFLTIPGTGDSSDVLRALGKDFSKIYKNVQIKIPPSIGSGGGIKAVATGKHEVARIAGDQRGKIKKYKLKYFEFAESPIAFVANNSVRGSLDLTSQQIVNLYAGDIKHWVELTGQQGEQKIYLLDRESGDSSKKAITKKWPQFSRTKGVSKVTFSTDETVDLLKRHPFTLAYLPFSRTPANGRVVKINGRSPMSFIREGGGYDLVVPFSLVYKNKLSPNMDLFFKYLKSKRAKIIMKKSGVYPK